MSAISIVIPVYNESAIIRENTKTILQELSVIEENEFSLLFVDDGSSDSTVDIINTLRESYQNIEILCLNRNFGKEPAIFAGLQVAQGKAVIVMDVDLQHPPSLIREMVALWQQGFDVVEAFKNIRNKETLCYRLSVVIFYKLFGYLTQIDISNQTDFKLLDRKVVDQYCSLHEKVRFFRGLVNWFGFKSARIPFNVPNRQHGSSKWTISKLLRLSISALSGFTSKPLHIISFLGIACFAMSLVIGGIALHDKFTGNAAVGFTTVIMLILMTGSVLMFGLWIIGIYLEQIFIEVKGRPEFIVNVSKSSIIKTAKTG